MARIYTVSGSDVAVSASTADLLEIQPASNKPCELFGIQIFSLSEVQEAEEEWLHCTVVRGNSTTGNGTSTTPRPVDPNATAAGFTAKVYGTTAASSGTPVTMAAFGVQVRAGYEIFYPEGCGFMSVNGSFLVVRMGTAPADALTAHLTFWIREMP